LGDLNTVNLNLPTKLANVTSDQALIKTNSTVKYFYRLTNALNYTKLKG